MVYQNRDSVLDFTQMLIKGLINIQKPGNEERQQQQ